LDEGAEQELDMTLNDLKNAIEEAIEQVPSRASCKFGVVLLPDGAAIEGVDSVGIIDDGSEIVQILFKP
jgi:hypothetical protein